jgi:hypothetical protein
MEWERCHLLASSSELEKMNRIIAIIPWTMERGRASPATLVEGWGIKKTLCVGDVFRNTNMNWGKGTKKSIAPHQQGDVFEYCF